VTEGDIKERNQDQAVVEGCGVVGRDDLDERRLRRRSLRHVRWYDYWLSECMEADVSETTEGGISD
jgi:hypothetical protein